MIDEALRDATLRQREDRRVLEAQLARAHRWELVGQLAAGIAHEINTPTQYAGDNLRFLRDAFADLRPLLTFCLALLEVRGGLAADADRRSQPTAVEKTDAVQKTDAVEKTDVEFLLGEIPAAIDQSLEGVDRVAEIVRSMRDFSHPDNGQRYPLDLNRAVESTLTISRNEWKYVAEATTDLDPGLPPVECMPGEISQVLLNLIVNAAHAIEAKLGRPAEPALRHGASSTAGPEGNHRGPDCAKTATGPGSRSRTPDREFPDRSATRSSSGSSRPRRWDGARARVWPSPGASWWIGTEARSVSTRKLAAAPCLRCAFQSILSFRLARAIPDEEGNPVRG